MWFVIRKFRTVLFTSADDANKINYGENYPSVTKKMVEVSEITSETGDGMS